MTNTELEHHRAALIENKLEKDKNMKGTSNRLWGHIVSRRYDFDAQIQDVQNIKKVTKQDLIVRS